MRWISVCDRLPPKDWNTLIWGDGLDPRMDFPLHARLCHDGVWLMLDLPEEDDAAAHTFRMCGNVTHWLEWQPPAEP